MVTNMNLEMLRHKMVSIGFSLHGASQEEIFSWESRNQVKLPTLYKEYFQFIAGIEGITLGHIRLHGLNEIATLRESLGCSEDMYFGMFSIGDFDDWVWAYAVNLRNHEDKKIYGTSNCSGKIGVVAENLIAFISLILEDPNSLMLVPST
jgi:hypothetical protein